MREIKHVPLIILEPDLPPCLVGLPSSIIALSLNVKGALKIQKNIKTEAYIHTYSLAFVGQPRCTVTCLCT